MITLKNKECCSGCTACATICPVKCIRMQNDAEGFLYPDVNASTCTECGLCERTCPIISNGAQPHDNKVYACYNKDEFIRDNSSSGGIFYSLAYQILSEGGIVYGAGFDEKFSVLHKRIDEIALLPEICQSKYVQSDLKDTFQNVKKDLISNKTVLFVGAPCQIAGLKKFLQKNYANLILIDFICHGVPSDKTWQTYLHYLTKDKTEVTYVSFRDKTDGWKNFGMKIKFKDGNSYTGSINKDPYLDSFNRNLILRPSCYQCAFKGVDRDSDITLSDLWGAQHLGLQYSDDKGVSGVLTHTEKGELLFSKVKNSFYCESLQIEFIEKYNPQINHSAQYNKFRNKFIQNLNKENFSEMHKRYAKDSIKKRTKKVLIDLRDKLQKK